MYILRISVLSVLKKKQNRSADLSSEGVYYAILWSTRIYNFVSRVLICITIYTQQHSVRNTEYWGYFMLECRMYLILWFMYKWFHLQCIELVFMYGIFIYIASGFWYWINEKRGVGWSIYVCSFIYDKQHGISRNTGYTIVQSLFFFSDSNFISFFVIIISFNLTEIKK